MSLCPNRSPRPVSPAVFALCGLLLAVGVAQARAQAPNGEPQPGDPPFVGGLRERLALPEPDTRATDRSGPRLWPILDFTNDPEGQAPHRLLWPLFRYGVWSRGETTERVIKLITLVPFMPLLGHLSSDEGRSEWEVLLLQWGVSPEDMDEWFCYVLPVFGYKQNDAGYRHVLAPPLFAWWKRADYRSVFVLPVFLAWDVARAAAPESPEVAWDSESSQAAHFSLVPFFSWSRDSLHPRIPALSWKTPYSTGLFPLAYRTKAEDYSSLGLAWPLFVRQHSATNDLTSMLLGLLFRNREMRAQPIDPGGALRGEPEAFRYITRDIRILALLSWLSLEATPEDKVVGFQHGLLPVYGYERAPNDARHWWLLSPIAKPFREDAPDNAFSWTSLLGLVNYRSAPENDFRILNLFDIRLLRTGGLLRYEADGPKRELRFLAPWGFGPRLRWNAGPA